MIIPLQFALALGMALLVRAHLRFRSIFLYIFLLPLAISDLAGIVWSAIFTERGYLNTILQHLGIGNPDILYLARSLEPGGPDRHDRGRGDLALDCADHDHPRRRAPGHPEEFNEAAEVFERVGGNGSGRDAADAKPSIQVALLLRIVLAFEVFSTVIAIAGDGTTVLAAEA